MPLYWHGGSLRDLVSNHGYECLLEEGEDGTKASKAPCRARDVGKGVNEDVPAVGVAEKPPAEPGG